MNIISYETLHRISYTPIKNLIETKELYNLTDAEEELLASKKTGNALVMIGSKRLHVIFEIPEYKFEFMGTAGGR